MTNGTKKDGPVQGDCDWCEKKDVLVSNGTCIDCAAKNLTTTSEVKSSEVEVMPSTTPINDRLKKAYIDKFNSLMVSGMNHEEIKYHIADMEDMIKVLQAQLQATLDVDEEWSKDIDKAKADALREKDKAYRAKARPRVNSDGTLKVSKAATKPKEVVAEGNKAFENIVKKLMIAGKTQEQAEAIVKGMMKL